MSDWLTTYYDDVDNMRLEPWLAHHTDDVTVQFGNNPPSVGKEEVGGAIGGFWEMIGGLRHTFVNVWNETDGTTILEARCDYETKSGETVPVPTVSVLHRRGELVDSLRIYNDLAPLFAKLGAP